MLTRPIELIEMFHKRIKDGRPEDINLLPFYWDSSNELKEWYYMQHVVAHQVNKNQMQELLEDFYALIMNKSTLSYAEKIWDKNNLLRQFILGNKLRIQENLPAMFVTNQYCIFDAAIKGNLDRIVKDIWNSSANLRACFNPAYLPSKQRKICYPTNDLASWTRIQYLKAALSTKDEGIIYATYFNNQLLQKEIKQLTHDDKFSLLVEILNHSSFKEEELVSSYLYLCSRKIIEAALVYLQSGNHPGRIWLRYIKNVLDELPKETEKECNSEIDIRPTKRSKCGTETKESVRYTVSELSSYMLFNTSPKQHHNQQLDEWLACLDNPTLSPY